MKGIDDLWQADLIKLRLYSRQNVYMLNVIDCFSKYAWAVPLKTKSALEITKAFREIFKNSKRVPRNLQTDHGTEFYNTKFSKLIRIELITIQHSQI